MSKSTKCWQVSYESNPSRIIIYNSIRSDERNTGRFSSWSQSVLYLGTLRESHFVHRSFDPFLSFPPPAFERIFLSTGEVDRRKEKEERE